MKLTYSAWAMPRLPVDQQVEIIRSLGYAGIELVSGPAASLDATVVDPAERKRIRKLVDDAGLELPSIAGHGDPLEPDAEKLAANLARVRAGLDLAADLAGPSGPPCLVCMGYGKPEQYETQRHQLVDRFGELARYAATRGVVLALEASRLGCVGRAANGGRSSALTISPNRAQLGRGSWVDLARSVRFRTMTPSHAGSGDAPT